MYPSILLEYKYTNKVKDPNGYFLHLVKYFFDARKKNKDLFKQTGDRYYDDMQNAMKIAANSLYGFLGTPGLQFNDPPGAAFVTETGREILQFSIEWATSKKTEYWQDLFEERTK
jgi:DNA polymerase elongation subunit (family B)